jgi:hypothetical protein
MGRVIIFFIFIFLLSCKKDRQCACTGTNSYESDYRFYGNKKYSQQKCEEQEAELKKTYPHANCELTGN